MQIHTPPVGHEIHTPHRWQTIAAQTQEELQQSLLTAVQHCFARVCIDLLFLCAHGRKLRSTAYIRCGARLCSTGMTVADG